MGDIDPVSGHIERLQRALTDARGRAVSTDGAVRVEAGANGTIHSIELGDGGTDLAAAEVVSLIVDLHREAVADAAATMREAVAALSNDPRLQDDRQEVVDKLARPGTSSEVVATQPHHSLNSQPPGDSDGIPDQPRRPPSADRQIRSTPREKSTPVVPQTVSTPMSRRRHQPAAPAKLSQFDPVTFAPLSRTYRPAQADPRPTAPEAAPAIPTSREPTVAEPDSAPATIEPSYPEVEYIPADPFAPWGEPGDGTGIPPGAWPPDDNLILSDDWWEWQSRE
ncbi:YbaB/EbfC family nucleoid-associated protein [Nocardia sp. NPDC058705]|uniref:YbaB/EbfC family nucleoid-associated protein n=1 Tax=Nocardia sp. NPDC058705 TaxID=3346609 RepID=UPI0036D164A5